ncbi:hypothetical protein [Pseudomonas aeruginosa]
MTSYVVGQALKADKIKLTDMVTVGKLPDDRRTVELGRRGRTPGR